ncbi:hypothetical protein OpiT1DRAFT_00426 [Opitutaceae bacterium TAV1]|nr:hypothetical protein OpiT1DRAFT_00426 [Opitutaceae bacterium TAV1]
MQEMFSAMRGRSGKVKTGLSRLNRVVSWLAAALVLFLLVAEVRPSLHAACCSQDHGNQVASVAHQCVITAFGQGQGFTLTGPLPVAPDAILVGDIATMPRPVVREKSIRLLPPPCGPPASALA